MRKRASAPRWRSAFAVAVATTGTLTGCGDAIIPSDFSGPPAGVIGGTVMGATPAARDASRPRLSLAWLAGTDPEATPGGALLEQRLTYQRSVKLQTDWDIGLGLPSPDVEFSLPVGARDAARIAIGKMVYFDDRVPDDRLDWASSGSGCDQVKAVSAQFVVYVGTPPLCQPPGARTAQPRLHAGYHYFSFDGGVPRELAAGESMSFTVSDRSPADSDPTSDLRAFAAALQRAWSVSSLDGC